MKTLLFVGLLLLSATQIVAQDEKEGSTSDDNLFVEVVDTKLLSIIDQAPSEVPDEENSVVPDDQASPESDEINHSPSAQQVLAASCTNKPTGLYGDLSSHCHSYYACVKGVGKADSYVCEEGFQFDRHHCACLPAHLVDCHTALAEDVNGCMERPPPTRPGPPEPHPTPYSDFCLGKGPGYYADRSRSCEWFFVCFGGSFQTTQFECPSHLRFNHFTCRCEYPFTVGCTVFDAAPCYPREHHHHHSESGHPDDGQDHHVYDEQDSSRAPTNI